MIKLPIEELLMLHEMCKHNLSLVIAFNQMLACYTDAQATREISEKKKEATEVYMSNFNLLQEQILLHGLATNVMNLRPLSETEAAHALQIDARSLN